MTTNFDRIERLALVEQLDKLAFLARVKAPDSDCVPDWCAARTLDLLGDGELEGVDPIHELGHG